MHNVRSLRYAKPTFRGRTCIYRASIHEPKTPIPLSCMVLVSTIRGRTQPVALIEQTTHSPLETMAAKQAAWAHDTYVPPLPQQRVGTGKS